MDTNVVFISAGPSPRMRFKRVQCPVIFEDRQVAIVYAVTGVLATRCQEEIMIFFKHVAICPVHGIIPTMEPYTEGNGGKS